MLLQSLRTWNWATRSNSRLRAAFSSNRAARVSGAMEWRFKHGFMAVPFIGFGFDLVIVLIEVSLAVSVGFAFTSHWVLSR